MFRTVIGILAGYLAIFLVIAASFTLLWAGLGQERAFHDGTTRVTGTWLAFTLPLNLGAAALGGWVAAWIDRNRPQVAVLGLIGVLLILGGASAVSVSLGAPPAEAGPPPPGLGPFQAASLAVQPVWVAWVLPILGSMGAWFGGSVRMLQASKRTAD
jgi:hypothetical protein